ncbi:MAG TPA: DUF6057 family protein [Chitinivibrionales bacterium]|nr:DUF6057 family protein [Chitinivibrionales bacterium]
MLKNPAQNSLYSRAIPHIVFFTFYFLYFYFIVDPQLRFFAHTTLGDLHLFTQKEVLLIDLWKAPCQLSLLCADFILRYLVFGWAGPALFTVCGICLFWITTLLASSTTGAKAKAIPYLPVLMILALPLEHDFIYANLLPFFLALALSVLYVNLPKSSMIRVPVFIVFAAVVYFVGENVFFIYCAICLLHEIFAGKSILKVSLIVVMSACIPAVARLVVWPTGLPRMNSLSNYLWYDCSTKDYITLYGFACSVPFSMLLSWIIKRADQVSLLARTPEDAPDAGAFSWRSGTLFCAAAALVGAGFLLDRFLHAYLTLIPVTGPRLWIHEATMTNAPVGYGVLFFIEIILSLSVSLLIYFRFSRMRAAIRFVAFFLLSLLTTYFLGAYVLIFASACILGEWHLNKKPVRIMILGITALALSFVITLIAQKAWTQALIPFNPFLLHAETNEGPCVLRMMQFFPLLMVVAGWGISWRKFHLDKGLVIPAREQKPPLRFTTALSDFLDRPLKRSGVAITSLLMLLVLGLVAAGVTFDFERHARFRLNYMARTGQWDKVLWEARYLGEKSLNANVRMDINRALFQTGRMSDDFFMIPQNPNYVLPGLEDAHVRLQYVETWLELGLISPAEEEAYNILAEAKHPLILLLLAKIHCVKDQPNTARVFLRALEQQPGCAAWAEPYERYLDNPASGPAAPEIKRLREQAFRGRQLMGNNTNVLALLEILLKDNPGNRMAFEYWMIYNLLFLREKKLASSLHLLNDLNVPGYHRLYQQAYLQMNMSGAPQFKVDSIAIEPATKLLYDRFMGAFRNRDPNAPPLDAVYGFRNTYFYLDLYLESMRNNENNKD